MEIEVFDEISEQNFYPHGYLMANPDVARANVDPHDHWERHGRKEGRRQYSRAFLDEGYWQRKYERFHGLLKAPVAGLGRRFPLVCSDRHHRRAEYAGESANATPPDFAEAIRTHPERNYLDLGCGLRRQVFENCLYLEVYPSITADLVVEPSCEYPIRDSSLDGIGCFAVLDHVRRPWVVVEEMARMLKEGGRVWIDWPFLQPVQRYPDHFYNATRQGLRTLFEDAGFRTETAQTRANQGFDHTVGLTLGRLLRELPDSAEKEELLGMTVRDLTRLRPGDPLWRKLIASAPAEVREAFACGNTLVATKAGG